MPAFCTFSDGERLLVRGIGQEVVEKLRARGGTGPGDRPGAWSGIPIRPEHLKVLYDDLLAEAGVAVRLCTELADVLMDGDRVRAAVLCGRAGLYAAEAEYFVDATGDAMLCALAGASWELGDEQGRTQGMTLAGCYAGVDWKRFLAYLKETHQGFSLTKVVEQALADGFLSVPDRHHSGVRHTGDHSANANVGHVFGLNPVDDEQLTQAYVQGRKLALEYGEFYRRYVPGFERVEVVAAASLMGVRESRRVVGEYVLTADDFKRRASFDDEIGRYCYPIDIHPSSSDPEAYAQFEREFKREYRYGKGESYGIPFRSLIPLGLANVLVAGRCISTDRKMQGSVRVMPCCFLTGQAAGAALALCAERGALPRDLDAKTLRDALRRDGLYVP